LATCTTMVEIALLLTMMANRLALPLQTCMSNISVRTGYVLTTSEHGMSMRLQSPAATT